MLDDNELSIFPGLKEVEINLRNSYDYPTKFTVPFVLNSKILYLLWFSMLMRKINLFYRQPMARYLVLYLKDEEEAEAYLKSTDKIDKDKLIHFRSVLLSAIFDDGMSSMVRADSLDLEECFSDNYELDNFKKTHSFLCVYTPLELLSFYRFWSRVMVSNNAAICDSTNFLERQTILRAHRFSPEDLEYLYGMADIQDDNAEEMLIVLSSFPPETDWSQRIYEAYLADNRGHNAFKNLYDTKQSKRLFHPERNGLFANQTYKAKGSGQNGGRNKRRRRDYK